MKTDFLLINAIWSVIGVAKTRTVTYSMVHAYMDAMIPMH